MGPHTSQRGSQSASYDRLRRRHIGWTVMAHHESHCERLTHLQQMHFQFGVIKTIVECELLPGGQGLLQPPKSPIPKLHYNNTWLRG